MRTVIPERMADKIMAVAWGKLGRRVGAVSPADMLRVQEAVFVVVGFEGLGNLVRCHGNPVSGLLHLSP